MARLSRHWGQTKPPVGYGVDWGDPINRGATAIFLFNEGAGKRLSNLIGQPPGSFGVGTALSTGNYWVPGKEGVAVKADDTGTGVRSSVQLALNSSGVSVIRSNVFTIAMDIYVPSYGINDMPWFGNTADSAGGVFLRTLVSTGKLNLVQDFTADLGSSNVAIPTNKRSQIAVSYDPIGSMAFYLNGLPAGTATSLVTFSAANYGLFFSNKDGDPQGTPNQAVSWCRVWGSVVPAREIMRLYTEPFAGIETRRIWTPSAAAGGLAIPPWWLMDTTEIVGANQS